MSGGDRGELQCWLAQSREEVPRNKSTKKIKDLYLESYKNLMKDIEDDTNKRKDIPCSQIQRINIVKMTVSHKAV